MRGKKSYVIEHLMTTEKDSNHLSQQMKYQSQNLVFQQILFSNHSIWSDHRVWMRSLSCIHVKFNALQFYVNALCILESGMNEVSQRKWALPLLLNLTQFHANWQPSLCQQFMQCASLSTRTQGTYTRSLGLTEFSTSTNVALLLLLYLIVSLFILHTSLSLFNAQHHHHFCINSSYKY